MVGSAALAHIVFGDFKLGLTLSILIGSIPGVLIGASVSSYAPTAFLRGALAAVLLVSGLKLVNVPTLCDRDRAARLGGGARRRLAVRAGQRPDPPRDLRRESTAVDSESPQPSMRPEPTLGGVGGAGPRLKPGWSAHEALPDVEHALVGCCAASPIGSPATRSRLRQPTVARAPAAAAGSPAGVSPSMITSMSSRPRSASQVRRSRTSDGDPARPAISI